MSNVATSDRWPSWVPPVDRVILAMAVPALATLAADPLVSLVDTAIVARLGTDQLAALAVNAGIFGFAFVVFNFLAYGTTPLVATAVATKNREEAGQIVLASAAIAVAVGLVGTAVLAGFAEPIARLMGASTELMPPTLTYLRIRALAAPAVLLITAGNGAFRGYADTRTPLGITLGLAAVNLVGDLVLVLGLGWGIAGAAWATVAAQYVGAAGFWWLLLVGRRERLGIPWALPRLASLRRLLGVGSVMSIRTFSLIGTLTVGTALATRMGSVTVAAHQIAMQLWLLFALFIDALALAAQILVADHLGRDEAPQARSVSNRLLVYGTTAGVLFAVLLWVGQPFWPWFFELEEPVAQKLAAVLPIVALSQPLNAAVFVADGIFMGARRFAWLAGVMVFTALATLPCFLLAYATDAGLLGLWWGMVVMVVARALGLGVRWWGPKRIA